MCVYSGDSVADHYCDEEPDCPGGGAVPRGREGDRQHAILADPTSVDVPHPSSLLLLLGHRPRIPLNSRFVTLTCLQS